MNSTDRPGLITGPWKLADLREGKIGTPKNGLSVFSCFHCGGGSSMGYKLAGFDVLGGVEIDPEMMEIYRTNHKPRHSYLMGVQDFIQIPDEELPEELFSLDVLDGSPPCSVFSMAGKREKKWGKLAHFREGQAEQVLDDLFFTFIEAAKKLQPKVVVAENVKGLIAGNARYYVKEIFRHFDEAGYEAQLFLLNASRMGVPQKRERTFFIARRKDLGLPKIELQFNEAPITVRQAFEGSDPTGAPSIERYAIYPYWKELEIGRSPKGKFFNLMRINPDAPCPTLTSFVASPSVASLTHWAEPRKFSKSEICRIQSFPEDYDFGKNAPAYVCGMSVPPLMMQRVADQISRQLFAGGSP